jgi:hypothetical protein
MNEIFGIGSLTTPEIWLPLERDSDPGFFNDDAYEGE